MEVGRARVSVAETARVWNTTLPYPGNLASCAKLTRLESSEAKPWRRRDYGEEFH